MTASAWLRLTTHPAGSSIVVNMANVWRLDEDRDGGTEIHSLGANTAGASSSVRVTQSVQTILAMLDRDAVTREQAGALPANQHRTVRHLYRSSNGDEWRLERDPESGQMFVLHRANGPSGGFESRMDIGQFLSTDSGSPERRELMRLLGTLI